MTGRQATTTTNADRQAHRQAYIQTGRMAYMHTYIHAYWQTDRYIQAGMLLYRGIHGYTETYTYTDAHTGT